MAPHLASAVHAVEANLFSFFQQLKHWPRIDVREDGDCVWTESELPYPLFNSVMRASVSDDRADRVIASRVESCRNRRVPLLWWTGPSTSPGDFGDRLDRAGFFLEPAFGMVARLTDSARVGELDNAAADVRRIAIERVADRGALATWSRILCDGFGAPQEFGMAFAEMAEAIGLEGDSPFRHYLACIDGEPAATCSLFLGAGVAGIYDVSTIAAHRRQGLGAAVTRRAMNDALASGFHVAILHASQLGLGVYRSLGFEKICDIGQHVWSPES